jgi:hypothetical protein
MGLLLLYGVRVATLVDRSQKFCKPSFNLLVAHQRSTNTLISPLASLDRPLPALARRSAKSPISVPQAASPRPRQPA